jgi:hypothetical protein
MESVDEPDDMAISLPAPTLLSPADKAIAPPLFPEEDPVVITTLPAAAALSPLDNDIAPEEDGVPVLVAVVLPEAMDTAPDASPAGAASSDCNDTSPVAAVSDCPPLIEMAPPAASIDPPAESEILLPVPAVLFPTDIFIEPPRAPEEEPVVIDIEPAPAALCPLPT